MLLIGKDVVYAASGGTTGAALTPDMLDAGSIGIYTMTKEGKFSLVILGASATGKVQASTLKGGNIKFAQGMGGGKFLVSEQHDIKGIQAVIGSKYAAASAQVTNIGYNGTNGAIGFVAPTVQTDIGIQIRERERYTYAWGNSQNASVPVYPTDDIDAALDRLVAQINSPAYGEYGRVVATKLTDGASARGIRLTAKESGRALDVTPNGLLEGAQIRTAPGNLGSGLPSQVAKLQEDSNAYRGFLYTASTFDKAGPNTVDLSKTYDLYFMRSINEGKDKTGQKATVDHDVETWIAFEVQADVSGTNQQADIEDILVALFPDTRQASA